MTDRLLRTSWLGGLGALVAGPPLLWLATAPPGSMTSRLSVLTGLFALSALVCAAVLPSRIRSLNRAFGVESVVGAHRVLGVGAAVLVVVHLGCVAAAEPAAVLDVAGGPRQAQAAAGATVALAVLVASAVARRRLRLRFEVWRWTHIGLGGAVIVFAALHVWWLDHSVRNAAMHVMLALLVTVAVAVAVYRWVWRARLDPATEFVLHEVRPESPTVSTLVLGPRWPTPDGAGSAFAPGQLAWLRLDRSLTAEEHPFTTASSGHADRTGFTVRHSGDFSRALRALAPGSAVWVDGPHGASGEVGSCGGFALIAGGVGITPMMSILRTAADRGDPRPYRMVVLAGSPEDLMFREELGKLRSRLDLMVTEVLRRPGDGWDGHTGDLGVSLLALVLRTVERPEDLEYYLCGPPGLIDDALDVLDLLDVAPARVHTELFAFV